MPDVHLGKGVTIGTVFASDKFVCPNAVGVDIGCGMSAVPVSGLFRPDLQRSQLLRIQERIKDWIPTGAPRVFVAAQRQPVWSAAVSFAHHTSQVKIASHLQCCTSGR